MIAQDDPLYLLLKKISWGTYGYWSKDPTEDREMDDLFTLGLIDREHEPGGAGGRWNVRLTDRGRAWLEAAEAAMGKGHFIDITAACDDEQRLIYVPNHTGHEVE